MNNLWLIISGLLVLLFSLLNIHDLLNLRVWYSSSVVADLLVSNGTIYTSDASLPFADSMAVRNGRILRIGNYSFVKELAGYRTQKLNVEGKVVVPGFIDSHVHLIFGGLQVLHGIDFSADDDFIYASTKCYDPTKVLDDIVKNFFVGSSFSNKSRRSSTNLGKMQYIDWQVLESKDKGLLAGLNIELLGERRT